MQSANDSSELPPVLQALGDDLRAAMVTGPARRRRRLATPAGMRAALRATVVRRHWRGRLALTTAVAAGASAAALILGSSGAGPQNAFAGWTTTPRVPATGQLQQAEAACAQRKTQLGSSPPAVADARGTGSLLIYPKQRSFMTCLTGSGLLGTAVSTRTIAGSPPAAGTIEAEGIMVGLAEDGQMFRDLSGQVGKGVTAVAIVLAGGGTVQASVSGGWFAAWWPGHWMGKRAVVNGSRDATGASVGASAVAAVRITTVSGTSTRPLNSLNMNIQPPVGNHVSPVGGG